MDSFVELQPMQRLNYYSGQRNNWNVPMLEKSEIGQVITQITPEYIQSLPISYADNITSTQETYPEQPINTFVHFLSHCSSGEPTPKETEELRIAFSELVANAKIHGNKNDLSKKISVSAGWDNHLGNRALVFAITDSGAGFDMNAQHLNGDPDSGQGLGYAAGYLNLLWNRGSTVMGIRIL